MLKSALAFALILLISTTTAMAQQRAVARACAADIKAQCAGVQPGEVPEMIPYAGLDTTLSGLHARALRLDVGRTSPRDSSLLGHGRCC